MKNSTNSRNLSEPTAAQATNFMANHAREQYTQMGQYSARQGHGFAAEDANTMADRLRLHNVESVGRNMSRHGADRLVDGVAVQTKYCKSAYDSVVAAFDGNGRGMYMYPGQKLEVPADQYDQALKYLRARIANGQVQGLDDPSRASEMLLRGAVTYQQSQNITRAGNLDSLKFDVKTQLGTCAAAAALSGVVGYVSAKTQGLNNSEALKEAGKRSATSGTVALSAGVATQQLLRTASGKAVQKALTKNIDEGLKAASRTATGARVVNALAGSGGRGAMAKALGSNLVTGTVILAAQTVPDAIALGRGKITGAEFGKRCGRNATAMAGGIAGAKIGAAAGCCLGPVGAGVGAVVGAIGGSLAACAAACHWF